jgi:hypothetical protein
VNENTETVTLELPMMAACALYFRLRHEWNRTDSLEWSDQSLMEALEDAICFEFSEETED